MSYYFKIEPGIGFAEAIESVKQELKQGFAALTEVNAQETLHGKGETPQRARSKWQ